MSAVSGNNNFWTRGRVKVACHFPFWERKFYVIFALGSESSRGRKFHPWNFRSRERKYVGTKVPVTRVAMAHSVIILNTANYIGCMQSCYTTTAYRAAHTRQLIGHGLCDVIVVYCVYAVQTVVGLLGLWSYLGYMKNAVHTDHSNGGRGRIVLLGRGREREVYLPYHS